MEIRDLELLLSVAALGSFAAAARKHDLDPSSVSRVISNLENELGVRLFQRTTRSVTLTDMGERYLQRIDPILEDLMQLNDEVGGGADELQGNLRITSSVAFAEKKLVPLLPGFQREYPNLTPELLLSDENLDLVSNRIDLAIRLADSVAGDVIASRWMNTRYRVVASKEYIDREGEPTVPEDIARRRCLVFMLPEFRSSWFFRKQRGETTEVQITPGMTISNALALRRAALEGLGPALLADWLIGEDIESGRLVDLFPAHSVTATSFDTGVWFIYPSRNYLPRKVRAMIDFLRRSAC